MKFVIGSGDDKLAPKDRQNEVIATWLETGSNCPTHCKYHPLNNHKHKCYTLKGNSRFHSMNNGGIDAEYLRASVLTLMADRKLGKQRAQRITMIRFHVSGDVINAKTRLPDTDYINALLWAAETMHNDGIMVLGYTHCWMYDEVQPLKRWFMASCDTIEDIHRARALGWMTTTEEKPNPESFDGIKLVSCPNQITDGNIKCIDCLLCSPSRFKDNSTKRVIAFKYT